MKCPNCGSQTEREHQPFCGKCGCRLIPNQSQPPKQSDRTNKPKPIVLFACGAAVLMLLFSLILGLVPDSPLLKADKPEPASTLPAATMPPTTQEAALPEQETTAPSLPEGYLPYISYSKERVTLHDGSLQIQIGALIFDEEVKNCQQMTIYMDITMNAGTNCKDWQVWGRVNGSFQKIAKIYHPAGDGIHTQTIEFDTPVTIDALAITPTIPGGYSWSSLYILYDIWTEV